MRPTRNTELTIRSARDADLDDVDAMIADFVKGHPAQHHRRSRSKLHQAYFGVAPVAKLVVATHDERGIGRRTNARCRLKRGLDKVAARARA
jgi:predicted hydrolase (HD superfamily)